MLINGKYNRDIESKILKNNSSIKIFYFNYEPIDINIFKSKKVICFAGIGNPKNLTNNPGNFQFHKKHSQDLCPYGELEKS